MKWGLVWILGCAVFGITGAHAAELLEERVPGLGDFKRELEKAVVEPHHYAAKFGKNTDNGRKLFCNEEQTYFVDIIAEAGDAAASVNEQGVATINYALRNTKLKAEGYRKGGWACLWLGGGGEIELGRIDVSVKLFPTADASHPRVALDLLFFDDLRLRNLNVGGIPLHLFPFVSHGNLPGWMNTVVKVNLDGWIEFLIRTRVGERLNDKLTSAFGEKLRKIREESGFQDGNPMGAN